MKQLFFVILNFVGIICFAQNINSDDYANPNSFTPPRFGGSDSAVYAYIENNIYRINFNDNSNFGKEFRGNAYLTISKNGEVIRSRFESGNNNQDFKMEMENKLIRMGTWAPAIRNGDSIACNVQLSFNYSMMGNKIKISNFYPVEAAVNMKKNKLLKVSIITICIAIIILKFLL
ncbi:MAG: hypothetical protein WCK02_01850 [Bacteroidota bacterium]